MKKILLFLSVLSLLSINSTFAQNQSNVFNEFFSEPNSVGKDLTSKNGWTHCVAGTDSVTINAMNLSWQNYQTVDASNSAHFATSTALGTYCHSFTTSTTKSIFMGLLYQDTTHNHANNSGTYFIALGSSSSAAAYIWVKYDNDSLRFGVSKTSGLPNWSTQRYATNYMTSLATGHLLVIEYTFNNVSSTDDVVKLFIDRDLITFDKNNPPTVGDAIGNTTDPDFSGTMNNISLRFNLPAGYIDNIAIDSVWGYLIDAHNIPDPTCKAAFTATSHGLRITCVNNSTGGNKTFGFDFGDGSGLMLDSLSHTYTAVGNYRVKLYSFSDLNYTIQCDTTANHYNITTVGINNVENELYANVYYSNNTPILRISTANTTSLNVDLINILGEKVENVYSSNSTLGQMILQPKMKLNSGIYFYQITSNKENKTIKVVVN